MNSSLLLQLCATRLVRLIWMDLKMGVSDRTATVLRDVASRNFFSIANRRLVKFSSSFFSIHLDSFHQFSENPYLQWRCLPRD